MFSKMKPAEKKLLEACKNGKDLYLGNERPIEKTVDNEIRGEFLRDLILNNNQEIDENDKSYILKIDSGGIKFSGAYISGRFDFSFCSTDLPFGFLNSMFENKLNLADSKIRFLSLIGSSVPSFDAFRLVCESDIFLRNGFEVNGEVNFISAQINGSLSCTNGKFNNNEGYALNCNGAKIEGSVFLSDDFEANGEVNFGSAQIGGNLEGSEGKFNNKNGYALDCNGTKIEGSVFLNDDFEANGKVNFHSSYIGKSLVFTNAKKIAYLNLESAHISRLDFDINNVETIDLDGFVYEHLDMTKQDFTSPAKWLEKMPKEKDFKPQPYKQLAKVLRNMGHHGDADDTMIKYNEQLTKKDFSPFKWIYGKTAGYGYKPMNIFWTMFGIWLFCGLFYWNASKVAVFAPNNPLVFQKKVDYECNVEENGTAWSDILSYEKYNTTNNWVLNEKLESEYTTFNPFWYSLDVILPIVDLQVEKDWGQYVSMNDWTLNDFTRWLMWLEIIVGWMYSLILVAILSGLAKNEKD